MNQDGILVDKLETHDRMLEAMKQGDGISRHVQDVMDRHPFGKRPFYLFGHTRTDAPTQSKTIYWQSRLSKPRAQANSFLFKCYPMENGVKPIWIIPHEFMFDMYEKGMMFESSQIVTSIFDYKHKRGELEAPEKEDPADQEITAIHASMSDEERAGLFSILFLGNDTR